MDKRRAIQTMTKAAQNYKDYLEDQKVLFLYGTPSDVKKQLNTDEKLLSSIQAYEVAFHRYNFLHLTGVKLNKSNIASAIHFYEKCLNNRLAEDDFFFAKDGSTGQKLDILERMMLIKKNVTMIGDFTDRGPKLFTEKAAGNICGCIGFVQDKNTKLNVPNTLLKKDIRDVTAQPTYKVFAVISKHYTDDKYSCLAKLDKSIDLEECYFTEEIEKLIDREKL
nr:PBECR4 domain-containing protein [uncultured Blautia sp.]